MKTKSTKLLSLVIFLFTAHIFSLQGICADYNWPEPIQKEWPEPLQIKPATESLAQEETAGAKKAEEKSLDELTEEERKQEKERLLNKIKSGDFTVEDLQRLLGLDNPQLLPKLLKREESLSAITSVPWYSFLTLYPAKGPLSSSDFLSVGSERADKYRSDIEKYASENGTDTAYQQLMLLEYACQQLQARMPNRGLPTNNNLEGAFADGKGMCRHYAATLNDVMSKVTTAGFKSEVILAYEGNEMHMWNRFTFSNGTTIDVDMAKDRSLIPLAPRLQPQKQQQAQPAPMALPQDIQAGVDQGYIPR